MNTVRSSLWGWGAFSVAVLGGMAAANEWRQDRKVAQVGLSSDSSMSDGSQLTVPANLLTPRSNGEVWTCA